MYRYTIYRQQQHDKESLYPTLEVCWDSVGHQYHEAGQMRYSQNTCRPLELDEDASVVLLRLSEHLGTEVCHKLF